MKKDFITKFLILLISIYFPIFLANSFLILRKWNDSSKKDKFVLTDDKSYKFIKNDFKPFYIPKITKNYSNFKDFYPIGSLPYTKTYWCDEGYGLINYKTDRFGLRNNDSKWSNLIDKKNIFLIGDSFIHGACVRNESMISFNLQKKLKLNSINLGSSGNGPYEYRALLQSLIKPILEKSNTKNIVLLIFYNNDNNIYNKDNETLLENLSPIISLRNSNIMPSNGYLKSLEKTIKNNFPYEDKELISTLINSKKHSKNENIILNFLMLKEVRIRVNMVTEIMNNIFIKDSYPTTKSIEYLSSICNIDCIPIIGYIPQQEFWGNKYGPSKYKELIISTSNKLNIKFIDFSKNLDTSDLKNYAPKGGHFSIEGYKLISDKIVEIINEFK